MFVRITKKKYCRKKEKAFQHLRNPRSQRNIINKQVPRESATASPPEEIEQTTCIKSIIKLKLARLAPRVVGKITIKNIFVQWEHIQSVDDFYKSSGVWLFQCLILCLLLNTILNSIKQHKFKRMKSYFCTCVFYFMYIYFSN